VITGFGSPAQKEKTFILRLREKQEIVDVGDVVINAGKKNGIER
jgi:hypothetical protein